MSEIKKILTEKIDFGIVENLLVDTFNRGGENYGNFLKIDFDMSEDTYVNFIKINLVVDLKK